MTSLKTRLTSNAEKRLAHPKYRPDIDGMRAIAVASVVIFHAFPSLLPGGFIGVDVFFVISGFLISTIIFESLDKGVFSFKEFYSRRIKRIFPALLTVLSASYIFGWLILSSDEFKQLGKHIAAGASFVSNLVLQAEAGYFDNSAETKPLLHLWSLGIEEQFYIVWPLVLWLAWKLRFNPFAVIITIAASSFYLNIKGIEGDSVATFYSPQTRAWELLCGSALAWFSLYRKDYFFKAKHKVEAWLNKATKREKHETETTALSNLISFSGFLLLAYGFWAISKDLGFPGAWAAIPVLGAVLIILAGPNAWINKKLLSSKIAVWLGLISFPLYLWHWPVLSFSRIMEGGEPSAQSRIAAVAISIFMAWLTVKLIERPIRSETSKRLKVGALVGLMLSFGCIGYATYFYDGLKFRSMAKLLLPFSDAKADWGYTSTTLIDGKIEGLHYLKGKKEDSVLFIGSSLMGQYFPRARLIYSIEPQKYTTIYASRNHCTPMPYFSNITTPENISCEHYYSAAMDLAKKEHVSKVVLAANWPHFYTKGKLTKSADQFYKDLKNIVSMGKTVYLISSPPMSTRFDPLNISKNYRSSIAKGVVDFSVPRVDIEPGFIQYKELKKATGVILINPFDYLCKEGSCPAVRSGIPLYMDNAHIRAEYAKSDATFIDEIVND